MIDGFIFDGISLFLIIVAIVCLLLVSYAEKRCLQDIEMAFPHQVWEKLKEEGDQQQPDMHSIHISISGDHYILIPEVIESFFDVERGLQQVELLVFIHDLLR